jgi:pimeloyl-ACP methyl ester carboxylesterase
MSSFSALTYNPVHVNGTSLHYEDTGGDGVPIVFSHGLLWSGRMYAAQVQALRARHRCITYDHRGQGQSPQSPAPYDMETLYGDAVALIEKLSVAPCHFVGLSMGGFIGMRIAARRPELLRSLTLISTAADGEPAKNIPKYRMMALAARVVGYGPLVPRIMKIMFGAAFLTDPARTAQRRQMEDELRALRQAPMRQALESVVTRRPITGELARIATPTQILHGTDDAAIVMPRARALLSGIKHARFVEIARAGHTPTIEEPAAITAALSEFLSNQ